MNKRLLPLAWAVAAVVAGPGGAAAGPDETETPEPEVPDTGEPRPMTARDVATAPRSHEARGLSTPDPSREESASRVIGRGLLSLPRWGFQLAMQPVRGAVWVYERYQIGPRLMVVFFDDTMTYGVYPAFFFETGFGFNAGVRAVHRDLFGQRESLRARAGWGGEQTQSYALTAGTGQRFGRVELELSGEIELRDRDRFDGIGDRDLVGAEDVVFPLDPLGEGAAVRSRYRQRYSRMWGAADVAVAGPLSARASAGIIDRKLNDDDVETRGDEVISDAYDIALLPGFSEDPTLGYGELELVYSTRRPVSRYVPSPWWSAGWHLRGFGGYANGIGDDASEFFRYGVDLQRYVNLFGATRVLVLRLYGEGLSEDPGPNVPFTELPSLGGRYLLRGYHRSRFRDRYIGMGSAEYQFDVTAATYGYLFVDAGKAIRDIDSDALDSPRVGFGGGFQINTDRSFLARILIAGTKDGDFLFSLTFEPQFDLRERFNRR